MVQADLADYLNLKLQLGLEHRDDLEISISALDGMATEHSRCLGWGGIFGSKKKNKDCLVVENYDLYQPLIKPCSGPDRQFFMSKVRCKKTLL